MLKKNDVAVLSRQGVIIWRFAVVNEKKTTFVPKLKTQEINTNLNLLSK